MRSTRGNRGSFLAGPPDSRRAGGGRIGFLFILLLDALLLSLFVAQAFIVGCLLAYGGLPLPPEWAGRWIDDRLPGFRLETDRLLLSPKGTVELASVRLFSDAIEEPLLTAEALEIELAAPSDGGWTPSIRDIVLVEGSLYMPAVHSPDGRRTELLRRLSFRLRPQADQILVENLAALHEEIRLRGMIQWPRTEDLPRTGAPVADDGVDLRRFYRQISALLQQKERFDGFRRPTIEFSLRPSGPGVPELSATVSSRLLRHPEVAGRDFFLHSQLRLDEGRPQANGPLVFSASELESRRHPLKARGLRGSIADPDWAGILEGRLPRVDLAADRISAYGIELGASRLGLVLAEYPEIAVDGTTRGLKGGAAVEGRIDLGRKSGRLFLDGSVDLSSLLPKDLETALPAFEFSKTPDYRINLRLAEGFDFEEANLEARVNGFSVDGLEFDHLRASLSYRDRRLRAETVYIERGKDYLDLGLNFDRGSGRYALTLAGSANPKAYSPILPRWWGGIFEDFDFPGGFEAFGDFIIQGRAGARGPELFYGSAEASGVLFRGVPVEKGSLTVRGRGLYAEVADLEVETDGGTLGGDIRFTSMPDEVRGPASVRMELEARLPLGQAGQLLSKDLAEVIARFDSDQAAEAVLSAAIFNDAYPQFEGKNFVDLRIDSRGPVRFEAFPLDRLDFRLAGRSDRIHIRALRFGYAGGSGRAEADLIEPGGEAPQLRLKLSLDDARQAEAIAGISRLETVEEEFAPAGNAAPDRADENNRLDLELHAEGPLADMYQYKGYGAFAIRGPELGRIDLLGPLSRALGLLRINFTSFALDRMLGRFRLEEGLLDFNRLEVNGPRTRVSASGTLELPERTLDMRVSVFLFANLGNGVSTLRRVGSALNPIPNLLEFELTGTSDDQQWRSLYDPRKLIPEAIDPGALIPGGMLPKL